MAAFKLPRLKSNLAIVNGQGRPTDFFLRLFNIDMAQRLEEVINNQQALLDAIVAAQSAADAAQIAAEAAQDAADAALAQSGSGARYIDLNPGPGWDTARAAISSVPPSPRVQLTGRLRGGTLDSNATWNGEAQFFESSAGTTVPLGVVKFSAASSGVSVGTDWEAEDSDPFIIDAVGTLSGDVTYIVNIITFTGPNYVDIPLLTAAVTVIPKAT